MMIFSDWHWPTFFISLIIFILAVNLWNVIKYSLLKQRADARAHKANAALQNLLANLKSENQKIGELIEKLKQPKG